MSSAANVSLFTAHGTSSHRSLLLQPDKTYEESIGMHQRISHHYEKSAAEVLYLANGCNSHMTLSDDTTWRRTRRRSHSHNLVLGVGASSCSATKNM